MSSTTSALTGAQLELLLDRLEGDLEEGESSQAIDLLARLRAHALRADSIEAIERLHVLWMRANDSAAAVAMVEHDGEALVAAAAAPVRATLRMRLARYRLQIASHIHDGPAILATLARMRTIMRHCLGQFANRRTLEEGYGEQYAQAIEAHRLRLLSLRDLQGHPHITLSVLVGATGRLTVDQIKGKQNRPPIERYVPDVLACLDFLGTDEHTPADGIAIGIVRTGAGWRRIEAVNEREDQARLVARYPQLIARLAAPTPMVEWLVAARQPELLQARPPLARSVRYAARWLWPAVASSRSTGATGSSESTTEDIPWPDLPD